MHTVCVLVCDSARARFFEVRGGGPWQLVSEVRHEGSRSKASGLVGDRAGSRSSEGASVHHNALAPASSPKDVEKKRFAHSLGRTLDQGMRSGRFQRWVLVAPPRVAGLVEKELTVELKKHLVATLAKDMSHTDSREVAEALRDTVRLPLDEQEIMRPSFKRAH